MESLKIAIFKDGLKNALKNCANLMIVIKSPKLFER